MVFAAHSAVLHTQHIHTSTTHTNTTNASYVHLTESQGMLPTYEKHSNTNNNNNKKTGNKRTARYHRLTLSNRCCQYSVSFRLPSIDGRTKTTRFPKSRASPKPITHRKSFCAFNVRVQTFLFLIFSRSCGLFCPQASIRIVFGQFKVKTVRIKHRAAIYSVSVLLCMCVVECIICILMHCVL